MRKGISFTLTIVVSAVVLLSAAFLIISVGQGSFQNIASFFDSSSDQSSNQLAYQDCMTQKDRLCDQNGVDYLLTGQSLDTWADEALVNGKTCRQLAAEENLFGAGGISEIPECDTDEMDEIQTCQSQIESFCSSNSGANWQNEIGGQIDFSCDEHADKLAQYITNGYICP